MGLKRMVIDAWSWLNYKPIYSDPTLGMPHRRAFPEAHATWVPAADERRLAAYKLLAAYDNNQAGELAQIRDGDTARERREFGDPSMFIDTLVSHVLGREQHITVPGAEHSTSTTPGTAAAARVQELLREWAEEEYLPRRMLQCERKAVGLGDGVYLLYWDAGKQRVRVKTYDPGFYFPVIGEDDDGSDFPDRVHIAWELPEDPKRGLKARLRRITYELDWIRPATASGVDRAGRAVRASVLSQPGENGEPPAPLLNRGDTVDGNGTISRLYAWNEQPTYRTCYLTDATWDLGDLKGPVDVDDLPMDKARYATSPDGEVLDRLDLYIDFVPVVHVPNTVPPAEEHWGQSSLAKALQVFDELQGTDTDSSRASATTGSPIIGLSGKTTTSQTHLDVGPGMVFHLGENGRMDTVNTAPQLAELRNHRETLAEQAANVVRLPSVSLGTMDPSKVPSGYALELSLGPLDSLISGMRLARDHVDRLLPKFAQRLFLAGQHPDWAGLPVLPAKIVRGPYTPTDKAAVLEQVSTAYKGGVISLETAVRMLTEAGWPIEDAEQEIDLIQSRQFEQARFLADALGNPEEVASFLGRQAPGATGAAPAVQLPAVPGDTATDTGQQDAAEGSGGSDS